MSNQKSFIGAIKAKIIDRYQVEKNDLQTLFNTVKGTAKSIWQLQFIRYSTLGALYLQAVFICYGFFQDLSFSDVLPLSWPYLLWQHALPYHFIHFIIATFSPGFFVVIIIFIWKRYPEHGFKILASGITLITYIYLCLTLSEQIFFKLLGFEIKDKNPLALYYMWHEFSDYPSVVRKLVISLLVPTALTIALAWISLQYRNSSIFGKAHWANFFEAKKAGLFVKEGIIIGKKWGRHLVVGGHEHVMVFAPSGSGKTRALAITNLLSWKGSCVCNDPKLELYKLTSSYRQQQGQLCFVWHPGSFSTHCYNPLDWIDSDKIKRIEDLQKIANIFIPDNPKTEAIWTAQPRMLFTALALLVLDTPDMPKTIGQIVRIVKNTSNLTEYVTGLLTQRTDLDPLCERNFNAFLQVHEKTRASVVASFLTYFELFDSPLIDAATSKSDFDIRELRKKKMTIYVGVTNDNMVRMAPLLTVFYQQVLDAMLQREPDLKIEPYSVLMLLEEMAVLRRMELLKVTIGLARSFGIRMMMLIQDLPQLYDRYGPEGAKAFINSKIRVAFAQNDREAAKLISDLLGYKTVRNYSTSQRINSTHLSVSETQSFVKRELMTMDEITKLDPDKAIILIEAHAPVLANKCFWDQDPDLKSRAIGAIQLPKIEPVIYAFEKPTKPVDFLAENQKQLLALEKKRESLRQAHAEQAVDMLKAQGSLASLSAETI